MGQHPNNLVGKEVKVTAAVLDWFYNTTAIGYQSAVVYDEDVQLKFLGGNVWSFKPNLPFEIHVSIDMLALLSNCSSIQCVY